MLEYYQTKVEGQGNCLNHWPSGDYNKDTTNHPAYITFYNGNIKHQDELTCVETQGNKPTKRAWLQLVNVS
jgi:hypothetical protein